eukprot:6222750-Heterocapsa_arctica.AAC.1
MSWSLQAPLDPHSPLTRFFGAPGRGSRQSGFNFSNVQSCRRAEPEADRWATFISTESPGCSFG